MIIVLPLVLPPFCPERFLSCDLGLSGMPRRLFRR